jgi:hypothetical protein
MIFPSQQRKESMALALAELDKVANPVICEVGRLRNVHAGESDGHSTLSFLDYVNEREGQLVSIDKDIGTEIVCRNVFSDRGFDATKGLYTDRADFVCKDALDDHCWQMLNFYDLLFLDGWDLSDPNSAKQHLKCLLMADDCIKPGGLVLIDDTGYPDLGKGKLVVPVAVLMGWTILYQGFQTLLRKPI